MNAVQRELDISRPAATRWHPRGRLHAHWLIPALYLAIAILLTWRLWADPAGRVPLKQRGVDPDVVLFAWFMRYSAIAVMHGHLPALVTTALNAPQGVNLMWNTPFLLLTVLLTPVTVLAGPAASLTIVLTLGFAGSAAAMFLVLRRWGCGLWPAALGGAVFGFSPALLDASPGHYDFQFAVLPPLIIDALMLIITGRGRPSRAGAWLGLLVAAQFFIAEEPLVDTALAGLVLVLAVSRPAEVRRRARAAVAGLAVAGVVALVICGYALWVQFYGPLTGHGSPWPTSTSKNLPSAFVLPSEGLLFHLQANAAELKFGQVHLTEYLAYLGWALLVVVLAVAVRYWRDPRVRACAVTFVVLELCSMGTSAVTFPGGVRYPAVLLPWHWLQHLPVLNKIMVNRLSLFADGTAAAVLAFGLDLARPATAQAPLWRRVLPSVVAVLAVVPLIPLPVRTADVPPPPAGWQATFTRLDLAPDDRVLVVPVNGVKAMLWQAQTGVPRSLIGGYCIAPNPLTGHEEGCRTGKLPTARYLDALWAGSPPPPVPSRAQIHADLSYWHPAAVVAVTSQNTRLGRFLTRVFGEPTGKIGSLLVWHHRRA